MSNTTGLSMNNEQVEIETTSPNMEEGRWRVSYKTDLLS